MRITTVTSTAQLLAASLLMASCTSGGWFDVAPSVPTPTPTEVIVGCTDPTASNFDDTAVTDDGSCQWDCQEIVVDHYDMLVNNSDVWRYRVGAADLEPQWMMPDFLDNAWATGSGGFGYGDGDDVTLLPNPTASVMMRITFSVAAPEQILGAFLHIDYDDGFVAWLNGAEIARANLGSFDVPPAWDLPAATNREARMYQGGLPATFGIPGDLLVAGDNVLAITVRNVSPASSDLTARAWLTAAMASGALPGRAVPAFFAQTFVSSNLPILSIDTAGMTIVDALRRPARLKTFSCAQRNHLFALADDFSGRIGIEFRGSSSQSFPKKPYGFETQDDTGDGMRVELLGLQAETDWVLHNPYSDKSLMRNWLAFEIGNRTGRYNSRARFLELVIDGEYLGVYLLLEKIKIDPNRVDISQLQPTDISGDEVTGGYVVKIDKFTGSGGGGWPSPVDTGQGWNVPFIQYHDPKDVELLPEQASYIENYVTSFELALAGADFADPILGWRAYADADSFIDYFLVEEITREVDSYRLSTYFYKDRDSVGGKITMGPLWDYNLGFGNANYMDGWLTSGWSINGAVPFWWDRLLQDPLFQHDLRCRWEDLRATVWSDAQLLTFIDDTVLLLDEAQQRNFNRWPILGTYVWPNWYVAPTWQDEMSFMTSWLEERLAWMDANVPGICN